MYLGFAIMLATKILEGIVRAARGLSFASSKHSLDSGLFGALGCCGGTTRKNKRRSHRHSGEQRNRESRARHSRAYSESTANTAASPSYARPSNISYLKPEQASIPYRESSDDDAGFIMESWSKTDLNLPGGARTKSKLTLESLPAEEQQPVSTGFTRVGGGRAHFDTPYAIAKGKQSTAPGRTAANPAPTSQFGGQPPFETPPPVSKPPEPLPKGAARPLHTRTRSQTAVIEDASTLYPGGVPGATTGASRSTSRPGSSGNASRPGSAGRSATQHGRPNSSGKSPASRSYSRSASSHGGKGGLLADEMGATHVATKSASTSKHKGRGWFGLGGPSGGDSSSEEEDEDESKASSGKKGGAGGRWGFKRRRNSESDMSPVQTPAAENRSFVVVRNRPQQHPGYAGVPMPPTEAEGPQTFNAFNADPYSPPSDSDGLQNVNPVLFSRTPLSPDALDRTVSPPSSYVAPRGSNRRMSSPPTQ